MELLSFFERRSATRRLCIIDGKCLQVAETIEKSFFFLCDYVKNLFGTFSCFFAANLFAIESETEDEISSVPNCF